MSDGTLNASVERMASMQKVVGRVVDVRLASPRSQLRIAHVDIGAADVLRFTSSSSPTFRLGDLVVVEAAAAPIADGNATSWTAVQGPSLRLMSTPNGPAGTSVLVLSNDFTMGQIFDGRTPPGRDGHRTPPCHSMLVVSSVPADGVSLR